jgi:hypothetical protein
MVGQPFTVKDYDRFSADQVWIMKKYTFSISKGDVSSTIVGFAHSADLTPEQYLTSNSGVLDVDMIGLRDKVQPGTWSPE